MGVVCSKKQNCTTLFICGELNNLIGWHYILQVAELQRSLEDEGHKRKAVTTENKLLKLDLEKAQSSEKSLLEEVASLKAQVGLWILSFSA